MEVCSPYFHFSVIVILSTLISCGLFLAINFGRCFCTNSGVKPGHKIKSPFLWLFFMSLELENRLLHVKRLPSCAWFYLSLILHLFIFQLLALEQKNICIVNNRLDEIQKLFKFILSMFCFIFGVKLTFLTFFFGFLSVDVFNIFNDGIFLIVAQKNCFLEYDLLLNF